MHELAVNASIAVAAVLACLEVPLWLIVRPLSLQRRLLSLICPVSQVAIAILAHVAVRAGGIGDESALIVACLTLACAALDVMVLRALVVAEGADAARQQAQAAREQLDAQREHLRMLRRAHSDAAELRGRMARMFLEVSEAISRGEKDRALELLAEGADVTDSSARASCANPVVSALLSAKAARCDELGIAWQFRGEVPERLGIPSVELSVLLSNLLDNAITAARGCVGGSAFVRTNIRTSHGFLVVSVENSYEPEGPVEEEGPADVVPEHGWGMRIVEALVRARDGELTIDCADGVWTARVIVQLD